MDEPLSNLDAKLRNQMRAEIIKLRQRINTTFVYVTHDQTEAMTLGDRIVIMKDGLVQQIGTPQQVFEHPINVFVAGFIGTPQMNFFQGQLEKAGNGYQIKCLGATIPVEGELAQKLAAKNLSNRAVTVGIRPEHITVKGADAANAIQSSIEVSELMGSELYLHATVGDNKQEIVMRIPTIDLPAEHRGGVPPGPPGRRGGRCHSARIRSNPNQKQKEYCFQNLHTLKQSAIFANPLTALCYE